MENASPREKLIVEQNKGSRGDIIIYLIGGIFLLFIIFPAFSIAVFTGAQSNTVWFGFIDTYVMIMLFGLIGGLVCFYLAIRGIKTYRRMKKEEEKIYRL